ncbi:MAG TPA: ABC transporter permease, partial [Terriglobales bacterium]
QGMTPEEARRQALVALGGIEAVRERSHAERPGIGLEIFLQDLRYALRQMQRAPAFTLSVIVVLVLGIGANAAMFTVLEGTLFRPLPYEKPGELVQLTTRDPHGAPFWRRLADIFVWQEQTHTLSQIAYYKTEPFYLRSQNIEQKVLGVNASSNLFATLGVTPLLGRTFSATEQRPGKDDIIILSDEVWRAQFNADRSVLGRTVRVNDVPATVIGIMPPGFNFPADNSMAEVWTPAALKPADLGRTYDATSYSIIARRKSGNKPSSVANDLTTLQKQLLPLYKDNYGPAMVEAMDYRRSLNANDQRIALLALLGSVALLWLIACANVASLMLARTAVRRREMAVRAALGAGRWRLVRQSLTESLLLSFLGGAIGLELAMGTLQLFRHGIAMQFGANLSLYPDTRVLLALFALSVLSAVMFGVLPAYLASGSAVDRALRQDNAQVGSGLHQNWLQRILVVSELALTLVMLVACGLLLRTVFSLKKVPLGFRTDHVFVIKPELPGYKYWQLDPKASVYQPLLERLKTIPGTQAVALTTLAPLDKGYDVSIAFNFSNSMHGPVNGFLRAVLRATGPEYQKVLKFGMVKGRYFNEQDTPDSQLVAVVNRAFAQAYEVSGRNVEGFTLNMSNGKDSKARAFKVVGVVDDFHQIAIGDPAMPEIDMNAAQMRPTDGFYWPAIRTHAEIVLRSSRNARDLIPELNHLMRHISPDLAGTRIQTMDQIVEDSIGSQLLAAHLLEALGGLALLVALAGLYSLLAYLVALRTRELGLRLALGAQRGDILTLILRSAGTFLIVGTAIGVVISLLTAHLLRSILFGVGQYDLVTLVAAPALLLCVGILAAWLPARRAALLEPMQALRTE